MRWFRKGCVAAFLRSVPFTCENICHYAGFRRSAVEKSLGTPIGHCSCDKEDLGGSNEPNRDAGPFGSTIGIDSRGAQELRTTKLSCVPRLRCSLRILVGTKTNLGGHAQDRDRRRPNGMRRMPVSWAVIRVLVVVLETAAKKWRFSIRHPAGSTGRNPHSKSSRSRTDCGRRWARQ